MLRILLCAALGTAILAGCSSRPTSQRVGWRTPTPRARGKIVSVDPAAGTLTVKVLSRLKPDGEEKTYQVEDDTTITSLTLGQDKIELKGKECFSDSQFKAGSDVLLTLSKDGSKVTAIEVGDLPQRIRGAAPGRDQGGGHGGGKPMQ